MRKDEKKKQQVLTRRALLLTGGKLSVLAVLTGRLYSLQVLNGDKYTLLAENNRINLELLAPIRGKIIDRHGKLLAGNKETYVLNVAKNRSVNLDNILYQLKDIILLSQEDIIDLKKRYKRQRYFLPVTILEDLSWDQVAKIEMRLPEIPSISIQKGFKRIYPYKEICSHVTGYVSSPLKTELNENQLFSLPGFKKGITGLEKTYDHLLLGSGGNKEIEVNAHGRIIRELSINPGKNGKIVRSSIDAELQSYIATRVEGQKAAIVVMHVHTGEILACYNNPNFDPNFLAAGDQEYLKLMKQDSEKISLHNNAIQGEYSPGSTFKMIVALAALESGLIQPHETVRCSGHMDFGGRRFHCWKKGGHGRMNMIQAIQRSCDVYFYELALKVGIDRISEMARRFGIGLPLDLDYPIQANGLAPTKQWKRQDRGEPWYKGETVNAGIGQGHVKTTAMQLVTMTARLASGLNISPSFFQNQKLFDSLDIDPRHLNIMKEAMYKVVNVPGGTALRSKIHKEGFQMAGKTGTVQVKSISMEDRRKGLTSTKHLEEKLRDHGIFVGFAPYDKPQFAASVIMVNAGGGSSSAAPVARDVLLETQERLRNRIRIRT